MKDWLRENDLDTDFEVLLPCDLDKMLARFYVALRKVDGGFYSKTSYISIRAAFYILSLDIGVNMTS